MISPLWDFVALAVVSVDASCVLLHAPAAKPIIANVANARPTVRLMRFPYPCAEAREGAVGLK
ncbi:MAG: hypothetical protein R2699_18350 [Acidimicrobiales bacterium]